MIARCHPQALTVILLLLSISTLVGCGGSPTLEISKETTYITEPLNADGYPDYEAWYAQTFGENVTPENNMLTGFFEVMGPQLSNGFDYYEQLTKPWIEIREKLGLPPLDDKDHFIPLVASLKDDYLANGGTEGGWLAHLKKKIADRPESETTYTRTIDEDSSEERLIENLYFNWEPRAYQPWQRNSMPEMSQWLDKNQKHIDRLVEWTKRAEYFYVPRQNNPNPKNPAMPMYGLGPTNCRSIARIFGYRIMRSIGENDINAAIADIEALYRLRDLMAKRVCMMTYNYACLIENMALGFLGTAAQTESLTDSELSRIENLIARYGPLSPPDSSAFVSERLMTLTLCVNIIQLPDYRRMVHRILSLSRDDDEKNITPEDFEQCDFNEVLRRTNQYHDQMESHSRITNPVERYKKVEAFGKQLQQMYKEDPQSPEDKYVFTFATYTIGQIGNFVKQHSNVVMRHEMAKCVFALAKYRRAQGKYPRRLADLRPTYLKTIPIDVISGKQVIYKPVDDGYLLYSVGKNGEDDGFYEDSDDRGFATEGAQPKEEEYDFY